MLDDSLVLEDTLQKAVTGKEVKEAVIGIENAGNTFMMGNGESLKEAADRQKRIVINEAIEKKQQEVEALLEAKLHKSADIVNKTDSLEIMPIYKYILIKPYPENPYQKIEIKNGLIVDLGGMAPTYRNSDSGEIEEEQNIMRVGQVLEVGPGVEYIRSGDDVFYKVPTEVPIPFFKQGLVVVNELNIMAVVNENLKARFNEM